MNDIVRLALERSDASFCAFYTIKTSEVEASTNKNSQITCSKDT